MILKRITVLGCQRINGQEIDLKRGAISTVISPLPQTVQIVNEVEASKGLNESLTRPKIDPIFFYLKSGEISEVFWDTA